MEPCSSMNSQLSLVHLDDDYILKNIETIYPMIVKYFSESAEDAEVFRALRITFGPCLNYFPLEELDDKFFKHACPVAKNFTAGTLKKFESYGEYNKNEILAHFCKCEEIALLLTRGIEHVAGKVSNIEIMKVSSLLLCSSELLYEFYNLCSKSKQFSATYLEHISRSLASFFRKAQNLQQNMLQLVSKIEVTYEESATKTLNEILTFFYKSGMVLMNLDLKTMADLWKGYICTLDKYSEVIKDEHDISAPIECLSENFINKLEKFISDNSANLQGLDKTSKILCFILKVIIKIAEKFIGCLKNCQKSLINLLIILNQFSHPQLGTPRAEHFNMENLKQLVTGVDPLLTCLINDKDFAHELSIFIQNHEDSDKRYPLLLLMCLIIKKLTYASQETRNIWLTSDENILKWIFHILSKCNFQLCTDLKFLGIQVPGKERHLTDCYGHLLMNISAFLLMSNCREFALAEKVLMRYTLETNPWCSLLAADIWCILARFADSELCYEQLNSLIGFFKEFGRWSQLPQKFLLESLIKRLFPLLSEKHRELFIKNQLIESSQYLWHMFSISKQSINLNWTVNNFIANINKFLNDNNFNFLDFEEMESAFMELTNLEITNLDKEFEKKLSSLWKFDLTKILSNPLSMRFFKLLCSATSSLLSSLSIKTIHLVLQEVKFSLRNFNPVIRFHCLEMVYQLTTFDVALSGELLSQSVSCLFYQFLTNENVFLRALSIHLFSNFAYSTCRTEIITQSINNDGTLQIRLKNYLQRKHQTKNQHLKFELNLEKLKNSGYKHICVNTNHLEYNRGDCREPPCKKIISQKDRENSQVENLIFILKTEAGKLRELVNALSVAQKMEISSVINLLSKIIGEKENFFE